jgi:hypothetical protein
MELLTFENTSTPPKLIDKVHNKGDCFLLKKIINLRYNKICGTQMKLLFLGWQNKKYCI